MKKLFFLSFFLVFIFFSSFKAERLTEISVSTKKVDGQPLLVYMDYTDYGNIILNADEQIRFKLTNRQSYADRVKGSYTVFEEKGENSLLTIRVSDSETPRKIRFTYIKNNKIMYDYDLDIKRIY